MWGVREWHTQDIWIEQYMGNGIKFFKKPWIGNGTKYHINKKRIERFVSSNIGQFITRETHR